MNRLSAQFRGRLQDIQLNEASVAPQPDSLDLRAMARAALGFVPGMWLWGLNLHRFLPPALAWVPWLLAAAALVPPIARRRPTTASADK